MINAKKQALGFGVAMDRILMPLRCTRLGELCELRLLPTIGAAEGSAPGQLFDLYALAALAGAAVVVIGAALHLQAAAVTIAGAPLCFGLRLMAIHYGWHLPIARRPGPSGVQADAPDDRRDDDARRR